MSQLDMLNVMLLYGPLNNYISALRKQSGLSQDELATLLGLDGRSSVGHYEQFRRTPELHVGIALELVFDEPIQRIFAGEAEKVRASVGSRARALLESMTDKPSAQNAQRLTTLARLARIDEEPFFPWNAAV